MKKNVLFISISGLILIIIFLVVACVKNNKSLDYLPKYLSFTKNDDFKFTKINKDILIYKNDIYYFYKYTEDDNWKYYQYSNEKGWKLNYTLDLNQMNEFLDNELHFFDTDKKEDTFVTIDGKKYKVLEINKDDCVYYYSKELGFTLEYKCNDNGFKISNLSKNVKSFDIDVALPTE